MTFAGPPFPKPPIVIIPGVSRAKLERFGGPKSSPRSAVGRDPAEPRPAQVEVLFGSLSRSRVEAC